jgi:hypothetical protein
MKKETKVVKAKAAKAAKKPKEVKKPVNVDKAVRKAVKRQKKLDKKESKLAVKYGSAEKFLAVTAVLVCLITSIVDRLRTGSAHGRIRK